MPSSSAFDCNSLFSKPTNCPVNSAFMLEILPILQGWRDEVPLYHRFFSKCPLVENSHVYFKIHLSIYSFLSDDTITL